MSEFLKKIYTSLGCVDPKWIVVTVGVIFGISSLWIGAFILQFAANTWWEFPAFLTTGASMLAGLITAMYGVIEL